MRRWIVIGVLVAAAAVVGWLVLRGGGNHGGAAAGSGATTTTTRSPAPQRPNAPSGDRVIAGRVVRAGAPVAASVRVTLDGERRVIATATAADDGAFELIGLGRGTYVITGDAPRAAARSMTVDLRAGDRRDLVIRLGACDRELAGTVTDDSGGPIVGARIDAGGALATTAADGTYRACTENARITLRVDAEGYASEQRALRPGSAAADFALRPEAVLAGVVVGPDRARIAGATVSVWPRDAIADASGRFELHGIGPGEVEVSASAPGFVTDRPLRVTLRLAANPDVTIALVATGTIRGIARIAGAPAAGVELGWAPEHPTPGYTIDIQAVTAADGAFEIREATLGPGRFWVPNYRVVGDVRVSVGSAPVTLELEPVARQRIRGRVVRDGAGVPDARIVLRELSSGGGDERTDSDGRFEVDVDDAGTYHVVAESDELGMASEPVEVVVAEGRDRDDVVLGLTRAGAAAGVVVDEAGVPVAGAAVAVERGSEPATLFGRVHMPWLVVTGRDGGFRISMLTRGEYRVKVEYGRSLRVTAGRTLRISGPTDQVSGLRVVVALQRASIGGRVVDVHGAPVSDAAIEVASRSGEHRVRRADVDGRFTADVLAGDAYSVTARGKPGSQRTLTGVAAGTNDLRIELAEPGSVRLECPPGTTAGLWLYTGSGLYGESCGAVVGGVPIGPVTAMVHDDNTPSAAARDAASAERLVIATGVVTSGRETVLVLASVESRPVDIVVTGRGKPLQRVMCFADHAPGSTRTTNVAHFTTADGHATIEVPRLRARLSCYLDGWMAHEGVIEADATSAAVELVPDGSQ